MGTSINLYAPCRHNQDAGERNARKRRQMGSSRCGTLRGCARACVSPRCSELTPIGTAGFALCFVKGYRRVPAPPPRMMARTDLVEAFIDSISSVGRSITATGAKRRALPAGFRAAFLQRPPANKALPVNALLASLRSFWECLRIARRDACKPAEDATPPTEHAVFALTLIFAQSSSGSRSRKHKAAASAHVPPSSG